MSGCDCQYVFRFGDCPALAVIHAVPDEGAATGSLLERVGNLDVFGNRPFTNQLGLVAFRIEQIRINLVRFNLIVDHIIDLMFGRWEQDCIGIKSWRRDLRCVARNTFAPPNFVAGVDIEGHQVRCAKGKSALVVMADFSNGFVVEDVIIAVIPIRPIIDLCQPNFESRLI
jgi:hypothetical protein